jgi:hypothetical protein
MARPSRNALILVAIVAVLGFATLGETLRERLTRPTPLTALDPRTIHRIALECPDCPARVLEKITGRWMLTEPYNLPADPAQVERLLALASAPVRYRRPTSEVEAKDVGLAPPRGSVTLGGARIDFGGRDPIRRLRNVRRGDEISLVPDQLGELPHLTAEALVDPHPFTALDLSDTRLDGKPMPEGARERLRTLQARKVQPAPAAAHGRIITVAATSPAGQAFELCRYGANWQLVRRDPSLAYVLSTEDAEALLGNSSGTGSAR